MPEKNPLLPTKFNTLAFSICFFSLLFIITFFSIYEITLIGNPFFDPITPSILWACVLGISWIFAFRYISILRSK